MTKIKKNSHDAEQPNRIYDPVEVFHEALSSVIGVYNKPSYMIITNW